MSSAVSLAFREVRDGWSADRVVADPVLNRQFLDRCRELQETASDRDLNLRLINLRKTGALTGEVRSKRTSFNDVEEYRFASEVAARHIERRDHVTLDTIICDPNLAIQFDSIASEIAPGFTPLQLSCFTRNWNFRALGLA